MGMASLDLLPAYAELHCLSNFSFLRGASHPEELVERAKSQGYTALALTDECTLAGAVRAHLAAKDVQSAGPSQGLDRPLGGSAAAKPQAWGGKTGLQLILGSEIGLADGTKLVLLATDRASYGDLSQLITRGRRNAVKGTYRLTRNDIAERASTCLALWLPALDLRAVDVGDALRRDAGWM